MGQAGVILDILQKDHSLLFLHLNWSTMQSRGGAKWTLARIAPIVSFGRH